MKWFRNAALAALMTAVTVPAFAQQTDSTARRPRAERGERMERPSGAFGSVNVEAALRTREQLKLSQAQIAQLETMRKEIVAQRQNEARDMIELHSRAEAGDINQEEVRKQMQARRDAMRQTMEQRQQRLNNILTQEQRDQVGRARREHGERMRGARRPGGMERGFRGPRPQRDRYRWQ